jgi:hypothetical protein
MSEADTLETARPVPLEVRLRQKLEVEKIPKETLGDSSNLYLLKIDLHFGRLLTVRGR